MLDSIDFTRIKLFFIRMYIVNAPFLFSGIWAIVKPWLDEKTRNKIHIKGSGYQKELLEAVKKSKKIF